MSDSEDKAKKEPGKQEVQAEGTEASASGGQEEKKPSLLDKSGESSENKPSLLDQTTSNQSTSEWLRQLFGKNLNIKDDEPKLESVLDEVSFEGLARYIASDKCKKIVTMAGAGISTSAGIPDFRSPGTGLYDNLEKYNLPSPQAVFDITYFQENPEPFFTLCKELWPGSFKPTPCHYFIKLLEKKNKLLRHFTQNIDTLERMAGVSDDKIIEAHGTFNTGHCQECRVEYTQQWMKDQIFNETADSLVPKCTDCNGVVKPDIVFFGESLPSKFIQHISDLKECDCLIIMGTSLVVQPFASLTGRTKDTTPRLYINLEKTGSASGEDAMMMMLFGGVGFDFDKEDNIRDIFWQGTCDDGCYALADLLGWGDELRKLVKDEHARLDKEEGATGNTLSTKSPTSKQADLKKTSPKTTVKTTPSKKSDKTTEKTTPSKKSDL